jgi:inositol-phosphate phosphatase/L-galactose 1-phosphate phosphatase/histidinol-phosphatase
MSAVQQDVFTSVFQQLANEAGALALRWFRSDIAIETKDDNSPVTQADRAIETRLREIVG